MKNLLTKIKERLSNESGFTMIELIIVIALIAIIGAMLVPSFAQTTARARIKTDINGIKTIQNAVDVYVAEATVVDADMIAATGIISTHPLIAKGYLPKADVQIKGLYVIKKDGSNSAYKVHLVPNSAITTDMLAYVKSLQNIDATSTVSDIFFAN